MRPLAWIFYAWFYISHVQAKQALYAQSLVPCLNSSGVTASKFYFSLDRASGKVKYDARVNLEVSGYVYAELQLFIYGLKAINTTIDPCHSSSVLKQLCPLTTGEIDIQGETTLGDSVLSKIPGIAFQVPDADAWGILNVKNLTTHETQACVRIDARNTKTVEQTAVKWVTAVLSGVGILICAVLSYFGSSVTAQHVSATTTLMFSYFQSMVILDMEAVERVPPMASSWAENVAWSVGLVYIKFMQSIFRWYVQATGGTPATFMKYPTKSVLVQRSMDKMKQMTPKVAEYLGFQMSQGHDSGIDTGPVSLAHSLAKRKDQGAKESYVKSTRLVVVYRGIKRVAYKMGIEETGAVLTTWTIFVFICICVAIIFAAVTGTMFLMTRGPQGRSAHPRMTEYAPKLRNILKGTLLKLLHIAYPSLMIFCMWEWVQQDSAAVITVSVFIFVLTLGILIFNLVRVTLIALKSAREFGTPAYLLYSHPPTLEKYGFLYSMFHSDYFYWMHIVFVYQFVKACFIAFSQESGMTQALAIFLIELAMLVAICVLKPFLSYAANAINITVQVVMTLNACFFLFFSNLMTQPLIVNGVMGVLFFIINAALSLVLLLYTIIYGAICIYKRPADGTNSGHNVRDDRQSFIMEKQNLDNPEAGELLALGHAAQADHQDYGDSPDWFESKETGSQFNDPFEPPAVANATSSSSDDRTRTMGSSVSIPVLNDLNTQLGHKASESQTSFGLGNNSGSSEPNNSRTNLFQRPWNKH